MGDAHSWEVHCPPELLRYVELFRVEFIPYEIYDALLDQYLRAHVDDRPLRVLSLGCGTGQHEANLAAVGHVVMGLDKDEESLRRARENCGALSTQPKFVSADLLAEAELREVLRGEEPFDAAIMLGVQLSMAAHARAATLVRPHLRRGGAFVTGLWGYDQGFDTEHTTQESSVEIAGSECSADYAVRLNTYSYFREGPHYFIDWDAVYLYPGPDGVARIHRRQTDRIEVAPERDGCDPLGLERDGIFLLLPSRVLRECGEAMCLPHTYEYLVGWRKL